MAEVILQLSGVEKSYGALRPLRIGNFTLRDGESVALVGVDGPAAEVLVDVITGAVLPDRGEAVVFGSATTAPADGESWLRSLDRFGIFSQRAVLLDGMTVAQNLALPFSLELNPISDGVRQKVVRVGLAVGLTETDLAANVGAANPLVRARVRLARALATTPRLLLAEHPNALVPAGFVAALAEDLMRAAASGSCSVLTLTADERFARAAASRILRLDPSTGSLREVRRWTSWFGRRR